MLTDISLKTYQAPKRWTPKLSVGVPSLDNQHKQLFDLADLLTINEDTPCKASLELMTVYLIDYCHKHLTEEEEYMRQLGYPGLDHHTQMHDQFRTQMQGFMDTIHEAGECDTSLICTQMSDELNRWLTEHIAIHDLAYKHWIELNTTEFFVAEKVE